MALSDINERRGPWSCEGLMPQCREFQDREDTVGRLVSRGLGAWDRVFLKGKLGKWTIFFIWNLLYLHFKWLPLSWIPPPRGPISPLPSPYPPIHLFLLLWLSIPLHCCTESFQDQGPLLPSSWASFYMWYVSWLFQTSRLISTYQRVHTMSVLLWLGNLT